MLFVYFAVVLYSSLHLSPSADESSHVKSGMTQLTREVYVDVKKAWWTTLDPLHPPLDMLPALLALWSGQSPDYRNDFRTRFENLLVARCANHLLGALILALVYGWARRLWGAWGGTTAALFLLLNPLFLAHSSIVSSDLFMAFGALVASFTLWSVFLARPDPLARFDRQWWLGAAACGLSVGFAVICKAGNVFFFPLMAAAAAWLGWEAARRTGKPLARACAGPLTAAALACLIGLILAAAVYHFTHGPQPPITIKGRSFTLPFGQALAVAVHTAAHLSSISETVFFRGRFEPPSPIHYAAAFLLKTPLGLLLLLPPAVVVGLLDARRRRQYRPIVYLMGLLIGLALLFTTRGFYLGLRHLLFLIVLLAALAGALGRIRETLGRRAARTLLVLTGACYVWAATDVGWNTPWHLSYFNPCGRRGPALVDSDGDWGEGLLALRDWQARHCPDRPLWLAYFGANQPGDFGVRFRGLYSPFSFVEQDPQHERGRDPNQFSGYVAISKTQLAGVYMPNWGASRDYYAKWRPLKPDFIVGGTICVYDRRQPRPPPAPPPAHSQ